MVLEPKGVMEPYREPRGRGGWVTLLVGALVFAGFGAVVGYAYFNGLPSFGGEPPVIRADTEPYRRAPDERGGLEVANASSSIVSVLRPESEPPRVERLLPPETPLAVEAPEPPPRPAPEAPRAAPPPAPPPPQAAAPAAPPAVTAATPQPSAVPPAVEPPPAAATPPATRLPTAKPPQLAALAPPAAPSAQVAPPRRAAEPAPPPQRQARVEPTAPIPPATQRRLPAESPAAAGIGRAGEVYRLQLAAVRTDGGLTQAWAQLKQRYPGPLGTVSPRIERTETTSGPLFRLQAGPFGSRETAADACGSIRAGGGQCFIVGPVTP